MIRSILFFLLLFAPTTAHAAEDHSHASHPSTVAQEAPADLQEGDYGYRHRELHELGVIDGLMKEFDSNCCDGGKGGECRITRVRTVGGQLQAWLNRKWCPLYLDPVYHLELPPNAAAAVCASKGTFESGCPLSYCAAVANGS